MFCRICGTKVDNQISNCPNCQTQVEKKVNDYLIRNFCPLCGNQITNSEGKCFSCNNDSLVKNDSLIKNISYPLKTKSYNAKPIIEAPKIQGEKSAEEITATRALSSTIALILFVVLLFSIVSCEVIKSIRSNVSIIPQSPTTTNTDNVSNLDYIIINDYMI